MECKVGDYLVCPNGTKKLILLTDTTFVTVEGIESALLIDTLEALGYIVEPSNWYTITICREEAAVKHTSLVTKIQLTFEQANCMANRLLFMQSDEMPDGTFWLCTPTQEEPKLVYSGDGIWKKCLWWYWQLGCLVPEEEGKETAINRLKTMKQMYPRK